MGLGRLLYVDVSVRTSGFPAALGFAVAVLSGYGVLDWRTAVALVVSLVGIVVVQGFEHALDTLYDEGGYSAFRSGDLVPVARRYARVFPLLAVPLALVLVLVWRPWLIVFGLVAARMAKLYVGSHNEWYATAGFMSGFAVGYFAATNYPSLAFLAGFVLTGFLYKASLSMYRLDDYLGGEFPGAEAVIQYYRNVFRYTVHYVPPVAVVLLLAVLNPVPIGDVMPYAWLSWVAGFGLMGLPVLRYRAENVYQEAPVHWVVVGIAVPELVAAWMVGWGLFVLYVVLYAVIGLVLLSFWRSRHAMCNVVGCPLNPLLGVERPR